MELIRRDTRGVAVLDLVGRLTSTDGAGLLKSAVDTLRLNGHTNIVLNLSKLAYMDSSGLGEIIACYSTTLKGGRPVKLANLTFRVQDLLTITKLITVFDTYDTEQEAIDSFADASVAASRTASA